MLGLIMFSSNHSKWDYSRTPRIQPHVWGYRNLILNNNQNFNRLWLCQKQLFYLLTNFLLKHCCLWTLNIFLVKVNSREIKYPCKKATTVFYREASKWFSEYSLGQPWMVIRLIPQYTIVLFCKYRSWSFTSSVLNA